MLDVCLNATYFQYRECFSRQKHGCAMGSPVSPIVANLYMEKVEVQALTSFTGSTPSHWLRYLDDIWVKNQTRELEAFSTQLDKPDDYVKFTRKDVKEDRQSGLKIAENKNLTGVPRPVERHSLSNMGGGTCHELLIREAYKGHSNEMPKPPHLAPLNVEEQRLYSELLPDGRVSHPISKRELSHPTEEAHFGRLYP
ncbi:hypothetical protein D4764_19G0000100 [Takifugu flavidus]|uniref:Reverse transcriptase domain-containing protein n=1 Tax=Takifugu flavidus TaxID=433684 RepID=A0A5C6NKW6_9TELE|nr:hypothetical protein D4764_19G0000100 [Takifugu flavidus]